MANLPDPTVDLPPPVGWHYCFVHTPLLDLSRTIPLVKIILKMNSQCTFAIELNTVQALQLTMANLPGPTVDFSPPVGWHYCSVHTTLLELSRTLSLLHKYYAEDEHTVHMCKRVEYKHCKQPWPISLVQQLTSHYQ